MSSEFPMEESEFEVWAVFKTDDPRIVHVVPCDEHGNTQHVLDMTCPDISRVEESDKGVWIVIHEATN